MLGVAHVHARFQFFCFVLCLVSRSVYLFLVLKCSLISDLLVFCCLLLFRSSPPSYFSWFCNALSVTSGDSHWCYALSSCWCLVTLFVIVVCDSCCVFVCWWFDFHVPPCVCLSSSSCFLFLSFFPFLSLPQLSDLFGNRDTLRVRKGSVARILVLYVVSVIHLATFCEGFVYLLRRFFCGSLWLMVCCLALPFIDSSDCLVWVPWSKNLLCLWDNPLPIPFSCGAWVASEAFEGFCVCK